jgi:copper(I)-binding protein
MKIGIAFVSLISLAACAGEAAARPACVAVTDAWCRATPKGAPTGGCYATLTASADDRLVAVETSAAARAEIHSMDMTGGVMRMGKLDHGLALPAGRTVKLEPGATHLMIIGPKSPMVGGGTLPLTFKFAKAPPQSVKATIRAMTETSPPDMAGMDQH